MCGRKATDNAAYLSDILQTVGQESIPEAMKLAHIQEQLQGELYYPEAEIPITYPLNQVIMKRAWISKEGSYGRPTITTAITGLTPFLMKFFEDKELAKLNQHFKNFNDAKSTTVTDIEKLKAKFTVEIPDTTEEMVLMLKRFGNLLYIVFTVECPLFLALDSVIKSFNKISSLSRCNMSLRKRASMLWIVLVQTRHFGAGKLNILPEFENMLKQLQRKDLKISYSECPCALWSVSMIKRKLLDTKSTCTFIPLEKKPRTPEGGTTPGGGTREKDKTNKTQKDKVYMDENKWHPLLKAAFKPALEKAGNPGFLKVFNFCGLQSTGIPGLDKRKNYCFQRHTHNYCRNGAYCNRNHDMKSDQDANLFIKAYEPFLKDPEALKPRG